jgi:hypothetical protein
MKTLVQLVENFTGNSKYLLDDETPVTIKADCIEVVEDNGFVKIIPDMNSSKSILVEGVTAPEDWYACKYNYIDGAWELCPDWDDPRIKYSVGMADEQ